MAAVARAFRVLRPIARETVAPGRSLNAARSIRGRRDIGGLWQTAPASGYPAPRFAPDVILPREAKRGLAEFSIRAQIAKVGQVPCRHSKLQFREDARR